MSREAEILAQLGIRVRRPAAKKPAAKKPAAKKPSRPAPPPAKKARPEHKAPPPPPRKAEPARRKAARPARERAPAPPIVQEDDLCPPCPPCPAPAAPPAGKREPRRASVKPILTPASSGGGVYGFRVKSRKTSSGDRSTGQVWLQGRWLEDLGFTGNAPYWVEYVLENATVVVTQGKAPKGVTQRHVHKPSDERKAVVIDLENKTLLDLFQGVDHVMVQLQPGRLVIRPADIPALIHERRTVCSERRMRGDKPRVASCFTGAGFLDLAAELEGYSPAFGIELVEEYASIYRANRADKFGGRAQDVPVHLGGVQAAINAHLQNLESGHGGLLERNVDLLVGGIPCQPYSKLSKGATVIDYYEKAVEAEKAADKALKGSSADKEGRARAVKKREDAKIRQQLVGLAPRFMQVVQACNPYNVVVEQVSGFERTQAHYELVEFLKAQGYHVAWRVVYPDRMGLPGSRERFVLIGSTEPLSNYGWPRQDLEGDVVWSWITPASKIPKGLSSTNGGWFTLGEKGRGGKKPACTGPPYTTGREPHPGSYFWCPDGSGLWQRGKYEPQIIGPLTKVARAVVKGYYSPDPAGPYVAHPDNDVKPGKGWYPKKGDRFRMFTLDEIKYIHGVPDGYRLDVGVGPFGKVSSISPNNQCAVLGQGVVVPMFQAVIKALPQVKAPRKRMAVAANPQQQRDWYLAELWRNGLL